LVKLVVGKVLGIGDILDNEEVLVGRWSRMPWLRTLYQVNITIGTASERAHDCVCVSTRRSVALL
jgi:hypothetical protein